MFYEQYITIYYDWYKSYIYYETNYVNISGDRVDIQTVHMDKDRRQLKRFTEFLILQDNTI